MDPDGVLIVDGEKNIRLTLSKYLRNLNLKTDTALNGEEALAKLEQHSYALILLDLKLPGMDGMDVLRTVRERWPAVQAIVVTAHGTIELAVEAMKLGAVDFIQKPFTPEEIQKAVTEALQMNPTVSSAQAG